MQGPRLRNMDSTGQAMPKRPSSQKLVNKLAQAQGWRATAPRHRLGQGRSEPADTGGLSWL